MEGTDRMGNIVLLLDDYSIGSRTLHTSFKEAGIDVSAVVINDDGFLPEDVISVYGYFLGDYAISAQSIGKPRYFNQLEIPYLWEISGNNTNAKVTDKGRLKAKIFYNPPHENRIMKTVDWLGDNGKVRLSEHYNKYGALWSDTAFDASGNRVSRTYFTADKREAIIENFLTGDIVLNDGGIIRVFKNRTEFVKFFLEITELNKGRIFFNSLSVPFFVSQGMEERGEEDILFWQEDKREDIPGNMQIILEGRATRCKRVVVQKKEAFDGLVNAGAGAERLCLLGNIYKFERDNEGRKEILICTNSDNIENINDIINGLPDMHFNIAAFTEMSSKLLALGAMDNVKLYPGVKREKLKSLFKNCDFYLDINHGNEIADAVRKAFLNNMLIFAFKNTSHNKNFTAPENIYGDCERLKEELGRAATDLQKLKEKIEHQKAAALSAEKEEYLQTF